VGVEVTQRGKEKQAHRGGLDWAQGRRPAMVCVVGSEGGEEEQGKQSTETGREEEERSEGGSGSRVPRLLFVPFSFFLIQFYHKTSTYCINNRIPGPLILNRIPKYNCWSAY